MFDQDNVTRSNKIAINSESNIENNLLFFIDYENFIAENLDIREIVIVQLLFSGYNQNDIAKHQRLARETVNRMIKKIRSKIKTFLQRK